MKSLIIMSCNTDIIYTVLIILNQILVREFGRRLRYEGEGYLLEHEVVQFTFLTIWVEVRVIFRVRMARTRKMTME